MYSNVELVTIKADIFEQVRQLIEPLTLVDRLSLIRDVLATTPIQEEEQPNTQQHEQVALVRQERRRKLKEEQLAWYASPEEQRQQYHGRYVAIYQGDVVDSDADRQKLYQRVRQEFDRQPIPIIPAEQSELPTLTIHSPRLAPNEAKES